MKCDFELSGTRQHLCDHVIARNPDCMGIKFEKAGWYQGGNDTFYLAGDDDTWMLYYWLGYDPRHEFGDEYVD